VIHRETREDNITRYRKGRIREKRRGGRNRGAREKE
jgi:hypothetical protein